MILAVDKQLVALSGQSEDELIKQMSEDVPTEGVTTEPYEDTTFVGTKYTLSGVPLAEFAKDSSSDTDLSIVRDTTAGIYTVSGELDLSDMSAAGPGAAMAQSLEITIAVTLPGTVTSHNGELDGSTVTWRGKAGEKLTMQATASDESSASWLLAFGIGIPVLLAIIGLFVWLMIRTRSPAPHTWANQRWPRIRAAPVSLTRSRAHGRWQTHGRRNHSRRRGRLQRRRRPAVRLT